jgi:acyl-CoA synthetase (AMP-forming)/AMP-acid ligase II
LHPAAQCLNLAVQRRDLTLSGLSRIILVPLRTAPDIEALLIAATTIDEALRRRAISEPHRPAYTFLSFGERQSRETLSCAELHAKAERIAQFIGRNCPEQSRVLLLFPPGPDFVAAFFGCLYAGAIAVPADLPRRRARWGRLESIVRDAAPALLSTRPALDALFGQATGEDAWLTGLTAIAVEEIPAPETPLPEAATDPNRIAFLQYTSGSTSEPKGVMVTHRNVLATMLDMQRGWKHDSESIMVTWLPTFHDMGLIYGTLLPIVCGFPCYAMAPAAFLQKPSRWLAAISELRGTHSAAPNSAYRLCAEKIGDAEAAELDLSSWRAAVNGAEPVRPETLEAFLERFRPRGFRDSALCPGYGLAEASLKVTSSRVEEALRIVSFDESALRRGRALPVSAATPGAQRLVSCGTGEIGGRIDILDPETGQPCGPGEIGEIHVQSGTIAAGYWGRPAETAATFRAGTLRTGDLGFLLDGELYVMGRIKDLIILNGLNIYPQDLEATVNACHPQLLGCPGAAFAVDAQVEERIAIVQEVARAESRRVQAEELAAAIRQALWDVHEVHAETIVLLRPGSIPRTTSGKIQRRECRARFLAGTLEEIARSQPLPAPLSPAANATGLEAWAIAWIARHKQIRPAAISPETPFADLGMTSLDAVAFSTAFFEYLGRSDVRETLLWEYPTVWALATAFENPRPAAHPEEDGLENLTEAELQRLLLEELGTESR